MKEPVKVQRFGSVVGLRSEKKDRYNELHAHAWPEINAMIKQCNIRNYSIYETELDGKLYLFSYFEYVGDDFKADMAKMAADPKTQEWWRECCPARCGCPARPTANSGRRSPRCITWIERGPKGWRVVGDGWRATIARNSAVEPRAFVLCFISGPVAEPAAYDHGDLYMKDGKPAFYLSQPYAILPATLKEIVAFCEKWGLVHSLQVAATSSLR